MIKYFKNIRSYAFLSGGLITIILFQTITCFVLIIFDIELRFFDTYRSVFKGQSLLYAIPTVCLIGPSIETILFQVTPIDYIQKISNRYSEIITDIISTTLFSSAHITNGLFYPLMVLQGGIVLAIKYLKYKGEGKGFVYTLILHGTYNLGLMIMLKVWHSS